MRKKARIGLISLGCPRNLVDSELILGSLKKAGYSAEEGVAGCDVAVINTCGFIEDAKKESIDVILNAAALKGKGRLKKIVVCGCLSQRYADDLKKQIPQIDAILGIDSFKKISDAVKSILKGDSYSDIAVPAVLQSHIDERIITTAPYYAYVKIAEGCRNMCSYCAIYRIRGPFRSRSMESVISEIKKITRRKKLSELNIIGQDITSYGIDNYGSLILPKLLKGICSLRRAHWIRLLYTHPRHFTDELIRVIADEQSICKYIDLPIQHINDRILKMMNRRVKRRDIEGLIHKIRKRIPGVALRTSVILGFPGESDTDFRELTEFIRHTCFERLGAFIYSREEGTPAYSFKQHVSEKIKRERFDAIMKLQQEISREVNARYLNKELEVLVERKSGTDKGVLLARTEYDAPEVDGQVYLHSKRPLKSGDFVAARITDTLEYDLVGEVAKR